MKDGFNVLFFHNNWLTKQRPHWCGLFTKVVGGKHSMPQNNKGKNDKDLTRTA